MTAIRNTKHDGIICVHIDLDKSSGAKSLITMAKFYMHASDLETN